MRLSGERLRFWQQGMAELPDLPELARPGRNGESLATDEAAVWKRVLLYRVARYHQPERILETHSGVGISAALYRHACPRSLIFSLTDYRAVSRLRGSFDLIDIDPFGQPWDALALALPQLAPGGVLLVSNGEALAVWRNLRRQQRYPTQYYGRQMPLWVANEYLPRLEEITGRKVQFFYAFPSSVRAILSAAPLPSLLWEGCPRWMWWLQRYAEGLCLV